MENSENYQEFEVFMDTGESINFKLSPDQVTHVNTSTSNQFFMELVNAARQEEQQKQAAQQEQQDVPALPAAAVEVEAGDGNDDIASVVWNDAAVRLFVELFRAKQKEFSQGLKRHNKVWAEIALEMKAQNVAYNFTGQQCSAKMAGLKRTYKSIKDQNKKSGNGRTSGAFYAVMNAIFCEKAWVEPPSIASSHGPPDPDSSSSSSSSLVISSKGGKKRRMGDVITDVLEDLKADREADREDRDKERQAREKKRDERYAERKMERLKMHQEKMGIAGALVDVLNKLAEK